MCSEQGAWRNGSSVYNTPDRNLDSLWRGAQKAWSSSEQKPGTYTPAPPCGCWAGPVLEGKPQHVVGELATAACLVHAWVGQEWPHKWSESLISRRKIKIPTVWYSAKGKTVETVEIWVVVRSLQRGMYRVQTFSWAVKVLWETLQWWIYVVILLSKPIDMQHCSAH